MYLPASEPSVTPLNMFSWQMSYRDTRLFADVISESSSIVDASQARDTLGSDDNQKTNVKIQVPFHQPRHKAIKARSEKSTRI